MLALKNIPHFIRMQAILWREQQRQQRGKWRRAPRKSIIRSTGPELASSACDGKSKFRDK